MLEIMTVHLTFFYFFYLAVSASCSTWAQRLQCKGSAACRILAPRPQVESTSPELQIEDKRRRGQAAEDEMIG